MTEKIENPAKRGDFVIVRQVHSYVAAGFKERVETARLYVARAVSVQRNGTVKRVRFHAEDNKDGWEVNPGDVFIAPDHQKQLAELWPKSAPGPNEIYCNIDELKEALSIV